MSTLIKTFSDGSTLEFDQGRFDPYCVYLTRPNKSRHAPLDIHYFTDLVAMGVKHGAQKVYDDFVKVFNRTTKSIDQNVLNDIDTISSTYGADALSINVLFTTVYAGMIAEQNKAFTKLGKRVKRLGMHQILIDNISPSIAVNYSKGKTWRDLDKEMKLKGF